MEHEADKPLVVIVLTEAGFRVRHTSDVVVVALDERVPQDRVYEFSSAEDLSTLRKLLGPRESWGDSTRFGS